MDNEFIIYALVDPRDQQIRYIGKSTYGTARCKEHFKPSNLKVSTHKTNWINNLKSMGLEPSYTILHTAENAEELNQLEIRFIKEYKEMGFKLTNGTDGGEGALGRIISDSTKELMSQKHTEYIKEQREKGLPVNGSHLQRTAHIEINGIVHKECAQCKETKNLLEYGKYSYTWDGLNRICKICARKNKNDYDKRSQNLMTTDQWKQSYVDRKASMSQAIKDKFANDPEYKKKVSKATSKAIYAVHTLTNERIEFESALKAKEAGYSNASVSIAIKIGREYKGYSWYFKKEKGDQK